MPRQILPNVKERKEGESGIISQTRILLTKPPIII